MNTTLRDADTAIQADVDRNEEFANNETQKLKSDTEDADAAINATMDAMNTTLRAADTAIQADVDRNEEFANNETQKLKSDTESAASELQKSLEGADAAINATMDAMNTTLNAKDIELNNHIQSVNDTFHREQKFNVEWDDHLYSLTEDNKSKYQYLKHLLRTTGSPSRGSPPRRGNRVLRGEDGRLNVGNSKQESGETGSLFKMFFGSWLEAGEKSNEGVNGFL